MGLYNSTMDHNLQINPLKTTKAKVEARPNARGNRKKMRKIGQRVDPVTQKLKDGKTINRTKAESASSSEGTP